MSTGGALNLVAACSGASSHTLVADPGVELIGDGTVRFSVEPALVTHSRRKLVGCLEDTKIDRLLGRVASIETIEPDTATPH